MTHEDPFDILVMHGVKLGYELTACMRAARATLKDHARSEWSVAEAAFLAYMGVKGYTEG